jgi:hypothetical protein
MRWRTFCEQILELCHSLEVNRIVLLGALLADVPYTRPLPISGSASEKEVAEKYKVVPTRYDGPTGIVGVLQEAADRADVDALSFWVHVPHYANNPPCPKATLALLSRLEDVLDLPVPLADLACNAAGPVTVAAGADITFLRPTAEGDELEARAVERASSGRSGVYDVTVTRGGDVIAEFRGRSRMISPGRPA